MLTRVLAGVGVVVTTCQRVETAIAELDSVDIVLTDYNLEVGTSLRLVEAALRHEVPCIIFSALEANVGAEARAAASLVLAKPIIFAELAAAITSVLKS